MTGDSFELFLAIALVVSAILLAAFMWFCIFTGVAIQNLHLWLTCGYRGYRLLDLCERS